MAGTHFQIQNYLEVLTLERMIFAFMIYVILNMSPPLWGRVDGPP